MSLETVRPDAKNRIRVLGWEFLDEHYASELKSLQLTRLYLCAERNPDGAQSNSQPEVMSSFVCELKRVEFDSTKPCHQGSLTFALVSGLTQQRSEFEFERSVFQQRHKVRLHSAFDPTRHLA